MRGLTDVEREMLAAACIPCRGIDVGLALGSRVGWVNAAHAVSALLARGCLTHGSSCDSGACPPGVRHIFITTQGRLVLRLDGVLRGLAA